MQAHLQIHSARKQIDRWLLLMEWQKVFPLQGTGMQKQEVKKHKFAWSNRQIWPWSTKLSRARANRVLPREHTGHRKTLSNNTREDSTHGHHQVVNTDIRLVIFFAAKDVESLYNPQKQDWYLTGSDHKILVPNSDLN